MFLLVSSLCVTTANHKSAFYGSSRKTKFGEDIRQKSLIVVFCFVFSYAGQGAFVPKTEGKTKEKKTKGTLLFK